MNELTIKPGTADITTNIMLFDDTTGAPKTGLTIANIDMTYIRLWEAAVKADATALALVTTAHTDNYGIEIDATNAPGVYRFDWPDAAFAAGVASVSLVIKCSGVRTKLITVNLSTVNANMQQVSDDATAADNLELIIENAKGADHKLLVSTDAQDLSGTLSVNTKTLTAGAIANATLNADVGSTAYATNIIALAVRKVLDELNLDHLSKVAVANNADMTTEVPDGTVLSNILSATGDTSDYVPSTDSLEAIGANTDGIVGTDGKVLISTDEQDLSGTLHVDAAAINDSTGAADSAEVAMARLGNRTIQNRSTNELTVYDFAGTSVAYNIPLDVNGATITAITIAFVDSDPDTITDSDSGFVAAGFKVGMAIVVSGSTSNDGTYTLAGVAAGTLTLDAGDSLTGEIAGDSVTITSYDVHRGKAT